MSCVLDDSFQFLAQQPIKRRSPLGRQQFSCPDQILIKTDGDILFQGQALLVRDLRVTQGRGKIKLYWEKWVLPLFICLFTIHQTPSAIHFLFTHCSLLFISTFFLPAMN